MKKCIFDFYPAKWCAAKVILCMRESFDVPESFLMPIPKIEQMLHNFDDFSKVFSHVFDTLLALPLQKQISQIIHFDIFLIILRGGRTTSMPEEWMGSSRTTFHSHRTCTSAKCWEKLRMRAKEGAPRSWCEGVVALRSSLEVNKSTCVR